MTTRIATYPYQQLLLGQSIKTQQSLMDLQVQISTGKTAQDYTGIAQESFRLVSLKGTQARAEQHMQSIRQADGRLQVMDSTIGQIFDVASRFRTTIVSALNGGFTGSVDTATEGANNLNEIAGLLGTQFEGRYLFGGSRTTTQPVDLAGWALPPTPINTPPVPTYDSYYYKGDDVMASVEADTGFTVDYGIGADSPAFEYVMRAMYYVSKAGVPADAATLNTALNLLNTAMGTSAPDASLGVQPIAKDLADLRSSVGVAQQLLDDTTKRLSDLSLYIDQNIGDIENVDITDAMSRLTVQQTQLQASYMTLTRVSQLSLVQFLK
jgi:flagellar hook-associated protein 3 FlgL